LVFVFVNEFWLVNQGFVYIRNTKTVFSYKEKNANSREKSMTFPDFPTLVRETEAEQLGMLYATKIPINRSL